MTIPALRIASVVVAAALASVGLPAAAGAAARDKLPTGTELGGGWHSIKTYDSMLRAEGSFTKAQQAFETSGAGRDYTRRLAHGRVEHLSIMLHVTFESEQATELFRQAAARFETNPAVASIGRFGQATAAQRDGRRGYRSIFRQGVTFGAIVLERTRGAGAPAQATLNAVGRRAAAKVIAVL
jgi:hypothetical protein